MIFLIVSISGLLCVFSVVSSSEYVIGINGTVTLPCKYSTSKGTYTTCWGRHKCSPLQVYCTSTILETKGPEVTRRTSDRYQLLGNISQGNVSLTITGATKQDEGTYCCRVEIPGLFNDEMTDVTLKVNDRQDKHQSGIT
ncbi:hepatitis A virus cellular receptor 1 homolog isoform X2 [Dendropsophus ebraccatus]|uniref:hepatitis A virus cellular receptor 1 homolog isoform X2 n=1 Tax=Dendropsophus ebraccatus TaxID=150705 RepID=UPI0038312CDE